MYYFQFYATNIFIQLHCSSTKQFFLVYLKVFVMMHDAIKAAVIELLMFLSLYITKKCANIYHLKTFVKVC